MQRFVLDSYALLAYFNLEHAGATVQGLLESARDEKIELYLSQITLGELYYLVCRRRGPAKAKALLEVMSDLPVFLIEASLERILAAAEVKASYPISHADSFTAALAEEMEAQVVTGDKEFKVLEPRLTMLWLP